ncbi:MAG: DUF4124 domain-containing protein [Marinagarivorans sp.]|nr:DUF4124 domain-containing protein [Marinagarivorans sp.]
MTTFINKYPLTAAPTLLLAALLANVCSAGEYYKWVDEKGITHFSERPVQAQGVQKISTSAAAPSTKEETTPEATTNTQVTTNAQEATNTQETSDAEETAATEAANTKKAQYDQARCADSQARLQTLSSGSRIKMDDGKGGFYFLDQQQITQELQKTRSAISESCQK